MKVNVEFCEKRAKDVVGISMNQIIQMSRKAGGLGYHNTYWSKVKTGDCKLKPEDAEVLAEKLECSVHDLYLDESEDDFDIEARWFELRNILFCEAQNFHYKLDKIIEMMEKIQSS